MKLAKKRVKGKWKTLRLGVNNGKSQFSPNKMTHTVHFCGKIPLSFVFLLEKYLEILTLYPIDSAFQKLYQPVVSINTSKFAEAFKRALPRLPGVEGWQHNSVSLICANNIAGVSSEQPLGRFSHQISCLIGSLLHFQFTRNRIWPVLSEQRSHHISRSKLIFVMWKIWKGLVGWSLQGAFSIC